MFTTVRDLDCQHQQHFDQTIAKLQSSLLDGEQHKWAKTPPQSDPNDAPIREHIRSEGREDRKRGHSRTRSKEHRQQELNRVLSKSRVRSKSHKHNKSRKCSKSHRHSKSRVHSKHEAQKPGVWPSQWGQSPSKGCREEDDRSHWLLDEVRSSSHLPSHSYEQLRSGRHAEHPAPSNSKVSKYGKLKEEVVK